MLTANHFGFRGGYTHMWVSIAAFGEPVVPIGREARYVMPK